MDEAIAAVAARQRGVFSRDQARAAGFSSGAIRHRVDGRRWLRVAPKVYALNGAPRTWEQRVAVSVLSAGPEAAASGRTAAALYRLRGFDHGTPEVLRPAGRSRNGVVGTLHETSYFPPGHRASADGIPVTSIGRTLADLARTCRPGRLGRAIDNALSAHLIDVTALDGVRIELRAHGIVSVALDEAVDDRGEGYVATESELEDLVVDALVRAGHPEPVRQRVLGGSAPIGRVDFTLADAPTVVVEAQSRRHHTALLDWEADIERLEALRATGFFVVEVTWRQLTKDPAGFLRRIAQAKAAASAAVRPLAS